MQVNQITKSFKITEHFTIGEMACKCGCNIPNDVYENLKKLCIKLEELRKVIDKPIIIISQYRCDKRNRLIGGAPKSQHKYGKAVDIVVDGMTPEEVANVANKLKFKGVGIYDSFTHVDIRSSIFNARWDHRTKKDK